LINGGLGESVEEAGIVVGVAGLANSTSIGRHCLSLEFGAKSRFRAEGWEGVDRIVVSVYTGMFSLAYGLKDDFSHRPMLSGDGECPVIIHQKRKKK
jgi:hypothetical protein